MKQNRAYRLADYTAVEPLVNNWAAWSDLISPVPYSLHMLHYQMNILSSYLANPEMHIEASQDAQFFGGPFVTVPIERAQEIEQMLHQMKTNQSDNIALATGLTEFANYIHKEAKGQSLEPYYEKVPDALRGYIELLYDYFSNPIVRCMETLLYESPYYKKELQSLRIFQQTSDDSRPFFLTTPRLPESDQIDWRIPFISSEVDELFKLEATPQPLVNILDVLGLSPADEQLLLPLLTQDIPVRAERWTGAGIRVRYFGHACVLVEWQGISVLTDPWIGVRSKEGAVERLSYEDLPERIDFALITHAHHDHFVLETLLRLRHKIECLVVPRTFGMFYADTSLMQMAKRMGFKHVIEMEGLDSIKLPDGEITAVPFFGEHADLAHGKVGYVIRAGKEQIFFAADSNCVERRMYEHIRIALGPIQTIFLGMECVGAPLSWMYGTFLPMKLQRNHDQSRRTKGCDSAAALNLIDALGGERVYIYAMGKEPWLQYSMGLGLSEDSVQIRESEQVLFKAHERGLIDARRPYIQFEIIL
jgi:L-ascorbate metabolism protein UlaG (beta-lactamase superfamily)